MAVFGGCGYDAGNVVRGYLSQFSLYGAVGFGFLVKVIKFAHGMAPVKHAFMGYPVPEGNLTLWVRRWVPVEQGISYYILP
jgi:hypothetical protein